MSKQKQFDSQKFCDAYNAFASRKVTMAEAAKMAEMCEPTFRKYLRKLLMGEPFPKGLFEAEYIWTLNGDAYKDEQLEKRKENNISLCQYVTEDFGNYDPE